MAARAAEWPGVKPAARRPAPARRPTRRQLERPAAEAARRGEGPRGRSRGAPGRPSRRRRRRPRASRWRPARSAAGPRPALPASRLPLARWRALPPSSSLPGPRPSSTSSVVSKLPRPGLFVPPRVPDPARRASAAPRGARGAPPPRPEPALGAALWLGWAGGGGEAISPGRSPHPCRRGRGAGGNQGPRLPARVCQGLSPPQPWNSASPPAPQPREGQRGWSPQLCRAG